MNMRTNIDLLDQKVLNNLDTGEIVIYRSGAGLEVTVRSIFDNNFEGIGLGVAAGDLDGAGTLGISVADDVRHHLFGNQLELYDRGRVKACGFGVLLDEVDHIV